MTGAIFISDDLVSVLHAISLIQHHVIWLLKHCAITLFSYLEIRCICSLLLKIHRSDEDCKRILNHCHKLTTCYGFETLSWDLQAMWSVSLWQWFWHFPLRPSITDRRRLGPDMIFVQNFTQPDFQAKSFTPQNCVICNIFLAN